ncbi:MAG: hypothetical protein P9M00_02815 [Candidatus Tritonobacter lacicola]|nr:hypothetical protein [Candidatus Tritonobacter lacicola]
MDIIERIKDVASLVKKYNDADLYREIIDLEAEALALAKVNLDLQRENMELKDKLRVIKGLKFKRPLYYAEDDEVPYCPVCWEKDQKQIHLQCIEHTVRYRCLVCDSYFNLEKERPFPRSHNGGINFSRR